LQFIPSVSGALTIAEMSKHIGFAVRRSYILTGIPQGGSRGGHGHKALRQCFICIQGQVTINVTKNLERRAFTLSEGCEALIVEGGCWRDLYEFSSDAIVIVLASEEYDEADYIRDYAEFRAWELSERQRGVPYVAINRQHDEMDTVLQAAVDRVIRSGAFIGGEPVSAFEGAFAAYADATQAVGVGNGLEALSLVLRAWGIGPGDEVIVPAHTFVATALAVEAVGATPILADVAPDTGLISIPRVAEAITDKTRAIIPVHLYGHPVDMDALRQVIADRPILLLEDACQAHGARYKGRRCGSLGDAAAFSFYPTKNLGALGDGGAVVTSDVALAQTVRQLANYGSHEKYRHDVVGGNSRLDTLQAAILSAKLPRLDEWNLRRRRIAARYLEGLRDVPGILLPQCEAWAEPVWHVFWIRCASRDALQAFLSSRDIGTNIHYPIPVHEQPCFAGRWRSGQFPVAEQFGREVLSLPLDPTHTHQEIDRVIEAVQDFCALALPVKEVAFG
jgi:dTDP-4-amino-4,6-dideoxygalactose transaminase